MTATPPASLVRAAHRLNPALDLDIDIVAVVAGVGASTHDEWSDGVLTNVTVDEAGAVRLTESGSQVIFQSGGSAAEATTRYGWFWAPNRNQLETLWIDCWPDPSLIGPNGLTLHSLDIMLGRKNGSFVFGNVFGFSGGTNGQYIIQVARLDENWNREVLGDAITIPCTAVAMDGGLISIGFRESGRTIRIQTGRLRTRTGSGLDAAGHERTADVSFEGDTKVSHLEVPMGFSIGISVTGTPGVQGAWLGMLPTATFPAFDQSAFWRTTAGARDCGPYSPDADGFSPLDPGHNPGYGFLSTGAVPGYGARDTAAQNGGGTPYGQWGVSRESSTYDLPQTIEQPGWDQPYHVVRAVTYHPDGTLVQTFDLESVPSAEVHFRADAAEPLGTSVTYGVRGRNDPGDAWTDLGAADDGTVYTGADVFRFYELTATLHASPDGLVTPVLQAAFFTARDRFATYRYTGDVDSTASVDPVTAQSEIGELKLPILRAGRADARDLATLLATTFAPSGVEAWVYLRETITGTRHFLNLYRLEDRDPDVEQEGFVFVSGMDRLKVVVPQAMETFTYPADGSVGTINTVTTNAVTRECTITVATANVFNGITIAGMRYEGLSGALAGTNWLIVSNPAPTGNGFTIVLDDAVQAPAVGDTFRLHSDITQRAEVAYAGQDFAAVYEDIIASQAAVPQRYRGAVPPTTGRTTTARLTADGRPALDPLQEVALHCGGAPAWIKGRITYIDLYGEKDVVARWSERDYVELQTPTGYSRRMPSITVKYGWDYVAGKFGFEVTYDDKDALLGLGRANLFDAAVLPDELCKWNDFAEAQHLTALMLGAWSTGVRLWKVTTVLPWPWVEMGDAVAVSTDQYTDRRIVYAADGITDIGTPIKNRVSVVGVVVARNLWGTEFTLAVRGLSAIAQSTQRSGGVGVTLALPPTIAASFDATGHLVITSNGLANITAQQVGVGTTPEAATDAANAAAALAGQRVQVTDTTAYGPGTTVYVAAIAHAAAGGVSEPAVIAATREGTGAVLPTIVATPSETATTGTLSLAITDTQGRITLVESRRRVGNAAWSDWTPLVAPFTDTVDLVDKQASAIAWRVTGTDALGVVRILAGDVMPFGIGARPLPPTIQRSISSDGVIGVTLLGDSDTTGFRYLVATDGNTPTDAAVRAAPLLAAVGRSASVAQAATLSTLGQRYAIVAFAYNAAGQESDHTVFAEAWVAAGNADVTVGTPVPTDHDITWPVTLAQRCAYVDAFYLLYAVDPGIVGNLHLVGARVPGTPIRQGDGQTSIVVPVRQGGLIAAVAFLAYDGLGNAALPLLVRAAALPSGGSSPTTPPLAPTAAVNIAVGTGSVTNRLTMPTDLTNFVSIRTYRDGVQYGADIPRTAGAGATQDVTHTQALSAGATYTWTYRAVASDGTLSDDTSPAVVVQQPAQQTQLAAPTSVVAGGYSEDAQGYVYTVTPASGMPSGTTYRAEVDVDGGGFAFLAQAFPGDNTCHESQPPEGSQSDTSTVRVRAEHSQYTASDYTEANPVSVPPAGGQIT
ncbi:MAG TPA: hypothetical protein VFW98_08315 [Gemmatimonadaceae bacterium]|nr:hypothetical protein [Gemmatimonadaceae bacterium]